MGQVSAYLRRTQDGYSFWCEACEEVHAVRTDGEPAWTFDGNVDAPTFDPSVNVTSGHFIPGRISKKCWCTYYASYPEKKRNFKCFQCHFYVRKGMVEFQSDCSHHLAGQIRPLPELPPHLQDT